MGMFSDMDIELRNCETSEQAHSLLQGYGLQRNTEFYSKCFKHWYDSKFEEDQSDYYKKRLNDLLKKGESNEKV